MKQLYLFLIIFISSAAMASSCPPAMNKKDNIDQIISKLVDVDGDGIPDRIELHIKGKDFYSPFKWELRIHSKNKLIYNRNGNNDRIDQFFSSPKYIGNCMDYDDCKCQWYFQGFMEKLIGKISPDNASIFDRTAPNSIYVIAKRALKKENQKNPSLVKKAINNAVERLKSGKAVVITVFDEPEIHTPPMVWMPEFRRFVPIYEE